MYIHTLKEQLNTLAQLLISMSHFGIAVLQIFEILTGKTSVTILAELQLDWENILSYLTLPFPRIPRRV